MDQKSKRLIKTCKIFLKNRKIFKNKRKNLGKNQGGKTSFALRIAVGQRQSHGQLLRTGELEILVSGMITSA